MASTYTHYAFARELIPLLPEEISSLVQKHRQLYDIACHGPDILFYYRPIKRNYINTYGHDIHDRKAILFFQDCLRVINSEEDTEAREKKIVYILGFITHFTLDSCIHGYVERTALDTRNNLTHDKIEVEFDRHLLIRDGYNPVKKSLIKHIVPSKENAKIIAPFFPVVTTNQVKESLSTMKLINNFFVAPTKLKRAIVFSLLKATGNYEAFKSQVINKHLNEHCEVTNAELDRRYLEALPLAVGLMSNFNAAAHGNVELNARFNHTFSWEDNS